MNGPYLTWILAQNQAALTGQFGAWGSHHYFFIDGVRYGWFTLVCRLER
jgi:hypothetical protein